MGLFPEGTLPRKTPADAAQGGYTLCVTSFQHPMRPIILLIGLTSGL